MKRLGIVDHSFSVTALTGIISTEAEKSVDATTIHPLPFSNFVRSVFCSLLIFSTLGSGGVMAQNAEVKAVLDSQEILIGDQIRLDISLILNDDSFVEWPVFNDTITAQLEVVEASIPDTTISDTGQTTIRQQLVITSFDTGFMVLPPIHFVFNNDSTQTLSTEPQLIFVSDIPVEMEADIKDIKEPYDVPYNWKKWLKWILAGLGMIMLIIASILLWRKYRKQPATPVARPKPKRPAHEIALEKLEALRQKKLWQNDRTKEFYVELSDIIREYIEFRFDVLALEMTTDEIISGLNSAGIGEAKLAPLKEMLQMADLAKFAKYRPVANENEQCFDAARTFVSNTLVMPLDEQPEEGRP